MAETVEEKESLARAHLDYRAEYCKTSRAKCKKCDKPMEAGSLKIAIMVKSRWHDGHDARYHHVSCFFSMKRPSSVAEISHFETLKYEDQKMIEKAIDTNGKSVLLDASPSVKEETKPGKGKKAKKRAVADEITNYKDFKVEYSKSSRAKCLTCEESIPKDTIRFAKMDYAAEVPNGVGPVPRWYHWECFAKSLEKLDFYGQVEFIPNFETLGEEDQKMLKKKIKPISPPKLEEGNESKRVKTEEDEVSEQEEIALKKQSKRFYELRDKLEKVKKSLVEGMLEHMKQKHKFKATNLLLDAAADVLHFGPLKPCPKCKEPGTMQLRHSSYICTNEDCDHETREPKRGTPKFPDEFLEAQPYFGEDYKFRGGSRIFPRKLLKAVEQREAENNNLVQEGAPLAGLYIGVIFWNGLKNDKEKIQKKVALMGGNITTVMNSSVFVILASKNDIEKNTPKIEVAKELGVPFAQDNFLFNINTKEDVVPQVTKHLITEWEGNLQERFDRMSSASSSSS